MGQEPSQPEAPDAGQAPEGANGQEPPQQTQTEPTPKAEPKTYGEEYVKGLRKEAAAARTELSSVKAQLGELTNAGKTEQEKLSERAAESERRASEAEARLLRYDVAAERGLDLKLVNAIAGTTREEIEANAAVIAERLSQQTPQKAPSFDGGARTTPDRTKPPEQAHNDFLMGILRPGA